MGAEIDHQTMKGTTALIFAVTKDVDEAIAKHLIEKGADLNCQDGDGRTALSFAAENSYETIVKLLTHRVKVKINGSHFDPLGRMEKAVDINHQDKEGWTALMEAAHNGHEAIMKRLIKNGADINIQNNEGLTAFALAIIKGHEKIVKCLFKKGADFRTCRTESCLKAGMCTCWKE